MSEYCKWIQQKGQLFKSAFGYSAYVHIELHTVAAGFPKEKLITLSKLILQPKLLDNHRHHPLFFTIDIFLFYSSKLKCHR